MFVVQAAARDVYRNARRNHSCRPPFFLQRQRLLEHQPIERAHDVELFGDRHEFGRHQKPANGVPPARQCFHPHNVEGLGVELRLEMRDEFIALEPAQDIVGNALGGDDFGLQRGVEKFVPAAPPAFGAIERDVGVNQQLLGV